MPGRARATRKHLDFYATPPALTRAFLAAWRPRAFNPASILEPAAGDGAMLAPLRDRFGVEPSAYDANPRAAGIYTAPIMLMDYPDTYDLIFTNPPFEHALDFARRGLGLLEPGGYLVLFLRLAFLASKKRSAFFREHLPTEVWVVSRRPRFTGDGSDWSDYAWFVWQQGRNPRSFRGRHLRW